MALERRRLAGLVWARKNKGIKLFQTRHDAEIGTVSVSIQNLKTGTVSSSFQTLKAGTVAAPTRKSETGAVPVSGSVPETGIEPVPETGTGLDTIDRQHKRTSYAVDDDFTPILESLIQHTGPCDDQAASKLLADCRVHAPNATVVEVADLLHQTALRLVGRRNVTSPRGLLLSTVPLQFQPVALGIYRRQKLEGQRMEQEQRELDRKERVRTAREILEDAFISADLRQWAQDILAEAGEQGGAEQ